MGTSRGATAQAESGASAGRGPSDVGPVTLAEPHPGPGHAGDVPAGTPCTGARPECGCTSAALWMASQGELPLERTHVLSTSAMLEQARRRTSSTLLVATAVGMLHQLPKANTTTVFEPVNSQASCKFMKMPTPLNPLRCMREDRDEVVVDSEVAARARHGVEKMLELGATTTMPVPR